MDFSLRLRWGLCLSALGAALALGAGQAFSREVRQRPAAVGRRAEPAPAAEERYQHALKLGLHGDYPAAGAAMERLATDRRGTETGAWALYQAALSAKAVGDERHFAELRERLAHEYPGHHLALRLGQDQSPRPRVESPRSKADCGPRSLLALCRHAGTAATLRELTELCGTDRNGTTMDGLLRAGKAKGFRAEALQVDRWFLERHRPAGIARVDGDHYVAFVPGRRDGAVTIYDPNAAGGEQSTWEALNRRCNGLVLVVAWGDTRMPPIAGGRPE